jgi:hypothetical protein
MARADLVLLRITLVVRSAVDRSDDSSHKTVTQVMRRNEIAATNRHSVRRINSYSRSFGCSSPYEFFTERRLLRRMEFSLRRTTPSCDECGNVGNWLPAMVKSRHVTHSHSQAVDYRLAAAQAFEPKDMWMLGVPAFRHPRSLVPLLEIKGRSHSCRS